MIKEHNSGISRGFAFIDFPSVVSTKHILPIFGSSFYDWSIWGLIVVKQGAARAMMNKLGDDGLVVDDRNLFFEYRYMHFTCRLVRFITFNLIENRLHFFGV